VKLKSCAGLLFYGSINPICQISQEGTEFAQEGSFCLNIVSRQLLFCTRRPVALCLCIPGRLQGACVFWALTLPLYKHPAHDQCVQTESSSHGVRQALSESIVHTVQGVNWLMNRLQHARASKNHAKVLARTA
jgi:hypothetical protein